MGGGRCLHTSCRAQLHRAHLDSQRNFHGPAGASGMPGSPGYLAKHPEIGGGHSLC